MARLFNNSRTIDSAAALSAVLALHVGAVIGLAQYQPAREAMSQLRTVMVSLITPPQEAPRPKPVVKQPIRKIEPLPPQPILAITEPTPVPARFEAPPTSEAKVTPPPAPVAAAPAPVIPPSFNADYLQNPAPHYPALSRRMGEEGRVVLRVFVNQQGLPTQVELRTSSGFSRLDNVALETVRQWKFMPARRGEQPIGAWVLVPISFSLRS
ncbi:MAG: TonB family protein [Betaproteobacteria bacterium]|nr:TonB family protein [Betaproteobacteria bacterium]